MKNLCDPSIDRYRIAHPAGRVPDDLRPWAGCFEIPFTERAKVGFSRAIMLRVIASRGGSPFSDEEDDHLLDEAIRWDHVSVSTQTRCPTWEELEFVKRLFFKPDECAMQLHVPPRDHVNNHPYCLHIWRPLDVEIPRPPSIMVGHQAIGELLP